ncbi:Gfo/Idh/MocA family oxidoreductase [Escherichia coli]
MASASITRYHLPYVLNRKDSWHVAAYFVAMRSRKTGSHLFPYPFHQRFDEVLNDPDVKRSRCLTYADSHFEYAKRALEAGNVLVEEPFTPRLPRRRSCFGVGEKQG